MYHGIGGDDGVNPEAFAVQLELLTEQRRVLPLEDALAYLGKSEAGDLAAVTFDDAYRDFAESALPILEDRKLHATLFVPVGHIGAHNVWDEGARPRRFILGTEELRALPREQVALGVHGLTHRRLTGLAPEVLHTETALAKQELQDLLGYEVSLFAYPYGQRDDFDAVAETAVREAGFLAACSTCFGRGSRPEERFRLRRVGIEPQDSLAVVARKLSGAYDWLGGKEWAGSEIRKLRKRVGTT